MMTCWMCKKTIPPSTPEPTGDKAYYFYRSLCLECRSKLQGRVTDGEPLTSTPPTTTKPATRPENEQ